MVRVQLVSGQVAAQLDLPDDEAATVAALFAAVRRAQPELYARWCDEDGELRHSLSVFVNGDHVRYHQGLRTTLADGDQVQVIALVAGG
jgi:sulfur-carrier protein